MTAHVLVVQPDASDPLCVFDGWLAEEGITCEVIRPYDGEVVPHELDADGLLVLGGDMSSLDDAGFPWLEDIRALMRRAGASGRPSLGICLGGQLMAQAFGGSTSVGDNGLEAGVVEVRWREEAAEDPVFGGLPSPFRAAAYHGDMIATLPSGAAWLGESSAYPHQAFRIGTSWGVQFHPEIDLATYDAWMDVDHGSDTETLKRGHDDFAAQEDDVLRMNRLIAAGFARVVVERVTDA